uniref:Ras-related protein Rab n=1 Tax=Bicosoecida sp. CB-2014 TaxID=1486930 RepID=A0A7S1GDC3_9STRA|mmetsp:Transcript_3824/g.14172  ORF Transcript_3824/g.14172 Transcript_3824/m.14172 type:complete len:225 (+) Transcript_3824:180-854(+)
MATAGGAGGAGGGAAPKDCVLKVLVLGDPATGKTSFIKRYVTNSFSGQHKPTVGVDFHFRRFEESGTKVALQLWDIAGQDRFGAIYRVYYKDAFGALLVFDLSRPETFASVTKWKHEIDSKVQLPNGKPLPVLLVGNKCDIDSAAASVDKEQLDKFCEDNGFIGWFQTSALANINIEQAVRTLVRNILTHTDAFEAQAAAAEAAEGESTVKVDLATSETPGCCG